MSNGIITNISDYQPNGVNPDHWMQGKPTRQEMAMIVTDTINNTVDALQKAINQQFALISGGMNTMHSLSKINAIQIQTLLRIFDEVIGDMGGNSFTERFNKEFERTAKVVGFLEDMSNEKKYPNLPMTEKIKMAQAWNANPENVKVKGFQFDLPNYLTEHMADYTQQEIEDLNIEFDMDVQYIPSLRIVENAPEEVTS